MGGQGGPDRASKQFAWADWRKVCARRAMASMGMSVAAAWCARAGRMMASAESAATLAAAW